ncbi:MAG: aldose 1-epimerase family protein [Clostridia bacterium]|nr:aldose 1-epimerase family protein [Clostridia bacterium]
MLYSIENEQLKIEVDTAGAQLMSVFSKKTDTEYLWQGDPAYWTGRAYNLFPFIGRMSGFEYTYEGKTYPSRAHGLARYFDFVLEEKTENSLTFLLRDNEETKKEYPFSFEFRVIFLLEGAVLTTRYTVVNTDERELICAFGGHPGINVPFGKGEFEDYYLDFGKATPLSRQLLDEENRFMANKSVPYPLVDGTKLPLKHDLFEHDAIILENTSHYVALRSNKEDRYVAMRFDEYPFIGFWHVNKPAPYVCLEPWSALPGVTKTLTELESKPYMTHVPANEKHSISFTLEIHE